MRLKRTSSTMAPRKMRKARRLADRSAVPRIWEREPETVIAWGQRAVTRMLTPAEAIMAITAGRRAVRTCWISVRLRYFR